MQDRFFKSIDNEIRMQVAHRIDGVPADKVTWILQACRVCS